MASTLKSRHTYICHFCHEEFLDRSSLLSHFVHCSSSTRRLTNNHNPDEKLRLPRLTKIENEILQVLKLRRLTSRTHRSKTTENSRDKIQFGETFCTTDTTISSSNPLSENENAANNSNTKSPISSYHHYKYSRRERENFYASVKRARLKKSSQSLKKTRPLSSIQIHQGRLMIHVPTQISSRQRLNFNRNNSYPLLFDMNFHSLVSLSREKFFPNYIDEMNRYFHLIHSIASQEFQIIVHSHDHEQTFLPYSAFSFLHLLRQTMMNYSINLQKTSKRDYFQAFSTDQQQCNGTVKHRRLESTTIQTQRDANSPPIIFVEDEKTSIEPEPSIRLNHCRTQTDTKTTSRSTSTKKSTDEQLTRVTRQNSSISTDLPTTNVSPTLETKPVIMSSNKLSKEWLTNTVFYRCHACSHEEFFLVLSRECLNLHLSSQHANMQENFKQRLCHFLNNQGRAVKIFQHYLKWQQPWSEKEIEQIFHLSNSHSRTKSSMNQRH